jgi:hypothetical protein
MSSASTAQDLLREMLHISKELDAADWRKPPPEPPSLRVRYARIVALARALGLGTVEDVRRGRFLEGADPERYEHVLASILAKALHQERGDRASELFWAQHAYVLLLSYRLRCERVLSRYSGLLEAGTQLTATVIREQLRVGEALRASLAELDSWLVAFLDPEARTFSRRELSRNGYPDTDVELMEQQERLGDDP